jgi:hypothetical protein
LSCLTYDETVLLNRGDTDIRALLRANHAALDMAELRSYFRFSIQSRSSMSSFAKSAEPPFAAEGDLAGPHPREEEDSYRTLDDLMAVIEALCPVWPWRETTKPGSGMLWQ